MKSQFHLAAQALQSWVAAQKLPPGARLPSSREIAKELGFTSGIMMRACQSLLSNGILSRNGYKLTVAKEKSASPFFQGIIYIIACPPDAPFVHATEKILTERGVQYRTIKIPSLAAATLPHVLMKSYGENPTGIILRAETVTESLKLTLRIINIPMVVYAEGMHPTTQSSVQMDTYRAVETSVEHLHGLGHRRIALVSVSQGFAVREWIELYQAACLKRGLKESASSIWYTYNYRPDVVHEALLDAHHRHPEVTAIITRDSFAVQATRTFSVPREISVVGVGELSFSLKTRTPITMVGLRNLDVLASWACADLLGQIQIIQSGRPSLPPTEALFVPELFSGKSTRTIQTKKLPAKIQVISPPPVTHPSQTWRKIYPFLEKKKGNEWRPLDLSKLANHSITRQYGWLGAEPLEHFPPGLRSIHGVPFQILNEKRNRGHAVITFRSPHSHSAKGKQLPTEACLKVNLRTRALYFLHGCGYAKSVPFAEYIMHFASGHKSSVTLVPLGLTGGNFPKVSKQLHPNIQDWWDCYEQRNFLHAHRVTVYDVTAPTIYERTLYTLEWINPRPADEVCSIEVRVDASAGPVLALVSVTALL